MKKLTAAFLVISSFLVSPISHAGLSTAVSCNSGSQPLGSCDNWDRSVYYDYDWSASATASANYGILKAVSLANSHNAPPTVASAMAQFDDQITINVGGAYFGSVAYMRLDTSFSYDLERYIGSSTQGTRNRAVTSALYEVKAVTPTGVHISWQSNSTSASNGVNGWDYEIIYPTTPFVFSFVVGTPFHIAGKLAVDSYSMGNAIALADAGHSAYWNGITSITDAAGNKLDYTVTSASGTDWSKSFAPVAISVPEPNSLGLLAIAVAGLFFSRWRQRSNLGTLT